MNELGYIDMLYCMVIAGPEDNLTYFVTG